MALLLNRKYGSRLECIYYILQSLYAKYNTTKEFKLGDIKFDEEDINNVHHFCQLLLPLPILNRKCCPYLDNKLNSSKCYATQSVLSDSTKSKAVSDIGGSLEALGFISKRAISKTVNKYKITVTGEQWVKSDFNSEEWELIARKGVLSYGVVIGFLSKIYDLPEVFSYQGLYLSYPHTTEKVEYTDNSGSKKIIDISTDSQRDSNTRTMTRIINWCVTVGLLEPVGVEASNFPNAHLKYRAFINAPELTIRKYKKTQIYKDLFNNKFLVENPLSYTRLHKNVGSLRENGGEDLRNATLLYNQNILNRRFCFVYILNYYSKLNKPLSFSKLINVFKKYNSYFFTDISNAEMIMSSEAEIADIVGIPFLLDGDNMIAKTTINERILIEEAPIEIINIAEKMIKEIE